MRIAKPLILRIMNSEGNAVPPECDPDYLPQALSRWIQAISHRDDRDAIISNFHQFIGSSEQQHSLDISAIFFRAIDIAGVNPFVFACLYRYCKSTFLSAIGSKMRLGLIIPTFNRDTRLQMSLKTILRYSLPFLDVYIHDNNSSDDTENIVNNIITSHPDQSIHYTRHNSNVGWFRTYLIALAVSTYQYCIISSDDDHLPEENLCFVIWTYFVEDSIGFISFDKRLYARSLYPSNGLRIADPNTTEAALILDSVNAIGGISISLATFRLTCADFSTEKNLLAHISLTTAACLRVKCASVSLKEFDPIINAYGNRDSSTGAKTDLQLSHIQSLVREGSLDTELYYSSVVRQALLNILFRGSCDPTTISHVSYITKSFTGFCVKWWLWVGNRIRTVATDNEGADLFRAIASRFLLPRNASNIHLLRDLSDLIGQRPSLITPESGTYFRQVLFSVFWIKLHIKMGSYLPDISLPYTFSSVCSSDLSSVRLDQAVSFLTDRLTVPDFLVLWSTDYQSKEASLYLEPKGQYLSNLPEIFDACLSALYNSDKDALVSVLHRYYNPLNWKPLCSSTTLEAAAYIYTRLCRNTSLALRPTFQSKPAHFD